MNEEDCKKGKWVSNELDFECCKGAAFFVVSNKSRDIIVRCVECGLGYSAGYLSDKLSGRCDCDFEEYVIQDD